jgi:hypothetical protein
MAGGSDGDGADVAAAQGANAIAAWHQSQAWHEEPAGAAPSSEAA